MAADINNISKLSSDNRPWLSGSVSTQIGGRIDNQDYWGAIDTPYGYLLTVCDGMGGGPAGALASHIAVEEIIHGVMNAKSEEARINIVIKAIRQANEAILARGEEDPNLKGMGSTCTVLLINTHSAIVAYVGDSRVYQLRGNQKKWRTFDHSMVFGLVKQGVITEEQARQSSQSNIITRALGIKPDIEVDIFELPYDKNDRFVLTTDGIHGTMPEKELLKYLTNPKISTDETIKQLVQKVEDIGSQAGAHHDNHTIAILDVARNSKLKEKISRAMKQLIWSLCIILVASIALNVMQYRSNKSIEAELEQQKALIDKVKTAQQERVQSLHQEQKEAINATADSVADQAETSIE